MIAGGLISGGGVLTGGDAAVRCGGVGGFPFAVTGSCLAAVAILAPGLVAATGREAGITGPVRSGVFSADDCNPGLPAIDGGGFWSFAGDTFCGVVGFAVTACCRG